ncbi:MAG: phosphoribosylanthranilate isomerase [Bacteroidota bacterium]
MRKIKLKICGMREAQNIAEVAEQQPDYMGFIFYEKSPRYVGQNFSPGQLPASIKRVGVFVNERSPEIVNQVRRHQLDYVQLHGSETSQQCEQLRADNIKIIKVFSIDDDMSFEVTKPYQGVVDFFLFDTKGQYYGGNARTFNWEVLTRYDQQTPFFLSGGLSASNIRGISVLKGMNIHALDVNSGVELSPARKDINKIIEIQNILNHEL